MTKNILDITSRKGFNPSPTPSHTPTTTPLPATTTPSFSESRPHQTRNPLPIINPKTGEIVSNLVSPPTQKKIIPIINPATGTQLEAPNVPQSSHQKNIIKKPFTVMINRPPKKPSVPQYHSTHHSNGNFSHPPPVTILKKEQQLFNPYQSSATPPSWNRPKSTSSWIPENHTYLYQNFSSSTSTSSRRENQNQLSRSLPLNLQDFDEEEEEAEVDKYEWTGLPFYGIGLSFLDDDDVLITKSWA